MGRVGKKGMSEGKGERDRRGGRREAGACPTKKIVPAPLPENGSFFNTEYFEKIPTFH